MDFLRYIVCTETCLHNTAQVFNYGLQTPDVHLNTSDEAWCYDFLDSYTKL